MNVVVYLIIVIIIMFANASKKAKQAEKRQQAVNRQQAAAARPAQKKTAPVQKTSAAKRPLTQAEIRKAAEALMSQRTPTPAQPLVQTKPGPAPDEGFYEGTSFGDESVDPCHDELYEDRLPAEAPDIRTPAPAFQLQFTPSSVMNGVIMSEVLNHHV